MTRSGWTYCVPVVRQLSLPDGVQALGGGDDAAVDVLVGVGAGLALLEALAVRGRRATTGPRAEVGRVDAEHQSEDEQDQAPGPAADGDPAASTTAAARATGVDAPALVEAHGSSSCDVRRSASARVDY